MTFSKTSEVALPIALGGSRKRAVDICGALLLLVLFSPLLIFFLLIVSADGGKPIFCHTRVGRNGKPFGCLKFRSMVPNAQGVLQQFLETDPLLRAEWNKDFKLKNDPRVSRIGKFLRLSSVDELPQLWNVLVGDMSLVGPRPIVTGELERYGDHVSLYLLARPGMTGLWQVSGRNNLDYLSRVKLDASYVQNWSLWADGVILFKTVKVVLFRHGAY